METHIGLEVFNLNLERRIFAAGGFTTSVGRVAEHIYRGLLFDAPEDWQYDLLITNKWRHKEDELLAFKKHHTRCQRLYKPPPLPLINEKLLSAWHRYGHPRFYVPTIKRQKYSLLQYTSETPWGDRPLAPIECCVAYDYYDAYVNPSRWETMRHHLRNHQEALWLTAISEYTRQDAIRLLDIAPERVRTIHIAVNHQVYQPEPTEEDDAHGKKWQLPPNYVLYVGSVATRKNVITLIRALERYNERASEKLPLIIAGNVPGANYLVRRKVWKGIQDIARQTPVRQIKHPTDLEMAYFYRKALMVVHPSVFEGFGLTVLEAMACGTPVVCGRHSSLIEVGGDGAVFVEDPKSVEELAHAISRTAESAELRLAIKMRGLSQAAKFRWQNFARQTVDFYGEILGSR